MKAKIIFVILTISAVVGMTFFMLKQAQNTCEICLEFNGETVCSEAIGPNQKEALEEAHRNACARLASGVTEVLACHRLEAKSSGCRP